MTSARRERILVLAHAHPDFSLGGGELAAYQQFQAYRQHPDVAEAWFLARHDSGRGCSGVISRRRDHEYLWDQGVSDWHEMRAVAEQSVYTWFADLVARLRPTIVHVHHYAHLGLDMLRIIKRVAPEASLFMTLHEYIAICANSGQMIKTDGGLCDYASLEDCARCFPKRTPEDFFLRSHRFQVHFDLVDGFISPSDFLRKRYIEWGIPEDRIITLENGQQRQEPLPPRPLDKAGRNRFGFFGQITPFKGLEVLLEALTMMTPKERRGIQLDVNGANLERQQASYRERIEALLGPLVKEGVVRWLGAYQPHQMRERLGEVDWVVVPSIWWENSPMVIQESFTAGRPLLVSAIGGMAEKVIHGVNGIQVTAGSSLAWRKAMLAAAADDKQWDQLRKGIRPPLTQAEAANVALDWFRGRRATVGN